MTMIKRPPMSNRPVILFPKSGLNGALPTEFDPNWQTYTDLTPKQIAAFQAFPEWEAKVVLYRQRII